MKACIVGMFLGLIATFANAVPVAGTPVNLTPPAGFVKAKDFAGFQNPGSSASIVVSDLSAPFSLLIKGYTEPKALKARHLKLLGKSKTRVDGHQALLLHLAESSKHIAFRKWLLAIDRGQVTTLVVATYPGSEAKTLERPLQKSLQGVSLQKVDPLAGVAFTIVPQAPFQIARVIGQSVILTPHGQFPIQSRKTPIMVVGLEVAGKGKMVKHRKAFAESRVKHTGSLKDIAIEHMRAVKVGKLSGYRILARGKSQDDSESLTLYQVILYASNGYGLIDGFMPAGREKQYLPVFERIAASFRLKP